MAEIDVKTVRRARRNRGRQQEWHWAAVREVIEKCPEMTHREADEYAGHIVRYVLPGLVLELGRLIALAFPQAENGYALGYAPCEGSKTSHDDQRSAGDAFTE